MPSGWNTAARLGPQTDAAGTCLKIDKSDPSRFTVELLGSWRLRHGMPSARAIEQELTSPTLPQQIVVDAHALSNWDSSLVNFLTGLAQLCHERGIELDRSALPEGLNRLVDLAGTNLERGDTGAEVPRESLLARTGRSIISGIRAAGSYAEFIGNLVMALGAAIVGRARYRHVDLVREIPEAKKPRQIPIGNGKAKVVEHKAAA